MDPYIQLLVVAGIVVAGYIVSKIASRILIKIARRKETEYSIESKERFPMLVEKGIIITAILIAISYLSIQTTQGAFLLMAGVLPKVIMILLLFILGFAIIKIIMWFINKFLYYVRAEEYFSRESRKIVLPFMGYFIKIVLYLALASIIFSLVEVPVLQEMLNFVLYPAIILFFFLIGVALINPVKDLIARIYLLNMLDFRRGNVIKIDGKEYVIRNIKGIYTELGDEKGKLFVIPNRLLSSKMIEFRKPIKEIETLTELKDTFVKQLKSHCGPATVEMALAILNYKFDQKELGKLMNTSVRKDSKQVAGTHPSSIISVVEKVTKGKVVGAWIGFDKIFDLKKEITVWLNQGALVIIDYKKKYLFPEAKYAHYSLVVGVRGDELLVVDPSETSGGVYFSDYRDVIIGMDTYSDLIKGKRGYIILAPKGTEAYERVKEGVIYFHSSMYDKVTKKLELYLSKISNPSAISEIIPNPLRKHLSRFKPGEQVSRVWKP